MARPKSPARAKRMNIHIDAEVAKLLRQEAAERRVPLCKIVAAALKERYRPPENEHRDTLIARRLNRIDNRLKVLERQDEIIAESIALYVRMWLAATQEIPEADRESTYRRAKERFERYCENLSRRLGTGQGLLNELPKEVVLKTP